MTMPRYAKNMTNKVRGRWALAQVLLRRFHYQARFVSDMKFALFHSSSLPYLTLTQRGSGGFLSIILTP